MRTQNSPLADTGFADQERGGFLDAFKI